MRCLQGYFPRDILTVWVIQITETDYSVDRILIVFKEQKLSSASLRKVLMVSLTQGQLNFWNNETKEMGKFPWTR